MRVGGCTPCLSLLLTAQGDSLAHALHTNPRTPKPTPHLIYMGGCLGFEVLLDEEGCGFESGFDLSLGVKKRNCLIQESNKEYVPQAMQQQRE